jgi:hypothetical protein
MRMITLSAAASALCGLAVGCQHQNSALNVPVREEFVVPPDEPRYTQPPEQGYKAPPLKRDWGARPGPGGAQGGMGGMGP